MSPSENHPVHPVNPVKKEFRQDEHDLQDMGELTHDLLRSKPRRL